MGNHLPGRGPRDCGPNQGGCSHGVAGTGSGRSNFGDADNTVSGEQWTTKARAIELAKASPTGIYTFHPSRSQLDAERARFPGGGSGNRAKTSPAFAAGLGKNPFDVEKELLKEEKKNNTIVRESQVDVFDPTDAEQMEGLIGDVFNQEINQLASIDNRMQNNFSGNAFGDGASVGNNNSENSMYQDASQTINTNRGAAKERAKKFLVFGQGY